MSIRLRKSPVVYIVALLLLLLFPLLFESTHAKAQSDNLQTIQAAGEASCASPPSSFDPTRASASQLAYYGLPQKPQTSQDISAWIAEIQASKQRTCQFKSVGVSSAAMHTLGGSRSIISASTTRINNQNWSGYVVGSGSGNGFNEAEGNWSVPCMGTQPAGSHALTWVGIGGYFEYPFRILQVGTIDDSNYSPNYAPSFWWEIYPENEIQAVSGITLKCTDSIHADVTTTPSNHVYIVDQTSKHYFSYSPDASFVAGRQSSEWINERPGCPNGIDSLLADYNYTSITSAEARPARSGATLGGINQFQNISVQMVDSSGTTLANADALNSDGQSFRDDWRALGNGTSNC